MGRCNCESFSTDWIGYSYTYSRTGIRLLSVSTTTPASTNRNHIRHIRGLLQGMQTKSYIPRHARMGVLSDHHAWMGRGFYPHSHCALKKQTYLFFRGTGRLFCYHKGK